MKIKEIKERFKLTGTCEIEYSGSGDEGFIDEVPLDSEEAREAVESWAYDELAERYGGWEINEGSRGTITIDFDAGTFKIVHGEHVIETREFTTEETF